MTRRALQLVALLVGAALLLAGCGLHKEKQVSGGPDNAAATPGDAIVKTSEGSFTIQLDAKDSPHTVASFEQLARKGFFDGTVFFRIVPGFVIQGGDPTNNGTGGPGYSTVDTPPSGTTYLHGTVAMAKSGTDPPGTGGSQFFVVTGADAGLPPIYAVLGHVVAGLAVVDRIGAFGNAQTEQATKRIVVRSITIRPS